MDYPAHITLVDAHSESDGSTYHLNLVHLEPLLYRCSGLGSHSGVIGCGIDTQIDKFLCHHFGVLAGETVDDARFFRMITDEAGDVLELCLFGTLLSYGEGEIGAVETAYERLPIEMKLAYDIFACYLVGCSCERHHRDIAEILVQHA